MTTQTVEYSCSATGVSFKGSDFENLPGVNTGCIAQGRHKGDIVDAVYSGSPGGNAEPVGIRRDLRACGNGGTAVIERPEQRRRRRKGYGGQLGRVHAGQIFKVTSLEGHAGGGAAGARPSAR